MISQKDRLVAGHVVALLHELHKFTLVCTTIFVLTRPKTTTTTTKTNKQTTTTRKQQQQTKIGVCMTITFLFFFLPFAQTAVGMYSAVSLSPHFPYHLVLQLTAQAAKVSSSTATPCIFLKGVCERERERGCVCVCGGGGGGV